MKKILLVIGLFLILLCGCSEKAADDSNTSQLSEMNGTDNIYTQEILENSVEVDFETGEIVEKNGVSDKNHQKIPNIVFENPKDDFLESTSDNQTSEEQENSSVVTEKNREFMNGFKPWQ